MSALYALPLSCVLPRDVWRAVEATLAEGGGVAAVRCGGLVGRVTSVTLTGTRDGSPAWLLCAGLAGASCVPQTDGTCEWTWIAEPSDEALTAQPFAHDLALRPTQRPAAN